jgi:hypothetical protein
MAAGSTQFLPSQLSAVAAWLRLQQGTITGSGYSSVPDVLASNPATQSTDGSRPPNLNSSNALPRADFDGSADFLSWPAVSNNNQTTTWGFAGWFEMDTIAAGQAGFICALPGATNRIDATRNGGDFLVDVYTSQFVARRANITSAFSAATKYFITFEFDGGGATEADRAVLTINAVVQSPTYSNGSGTPPGSTMPTSLISTAGPYIIGSRTSGTGFLDGKMGPNLYILGSKMTGATQGLLTTAARAALMGFEQPT